MSILIGLGCASVMEWREYEKRCGVNAEQKQVMERLEESIIDSLNRETMLPQERYEPGLMTGLAGIGCTLGEII